MPLVRGKYLPGCIGDLATPAKKILLSALVSRTLGAQRKEDSIVQPSVTS